MRSTLLKILFLLWSFVVALFSSCGDENKIDTPQISSYNIVNQAYMADSVPFSITVSSDYPMNSMRIQFYSNNEKVSERIIPVNEAGTYGGKLFVPFVKGVDDGIAEVRIIATNKNFDYSVKSVTLQIVRPKFSYLTLKTAYGDFRMEPVPDEPYKYAVSYAFPVQEFKGIIEAPVYGDNGNSFLFGGTSIQANALSTDSIPFLTDLPVGTPYTVSFDVRSYDIEPFVKPSFEGVEFPSYTNGLAVVEKELTQNQQIRIRGFLDITEWWIDPTFFDIDVAGNYLFRAVNGKYRITADSNFKFFRIEPMNGSGLADFDPITKTGGLWVNGGIGDMGSLPNPLGIPSYEANACLWNPEKSFAMAPVGNGIYQVKLIAEKTIRQSTSGNTVGIAFYQNSRSLNNPVVLNLVQTLYGNPGVPELSGGSERFMLKTTPNAYSQGHYIVTGSNRALGGGQKYVFTLNTNYTPVQVTITREEN
ncbi:MAG: DUF5125 domain-containing protein [Dysgonamonadaceae bacterium]|jgi:hypothetical protein|nr:DUF5125 domain-containing protein [Dysgonamonadaceae bacterium]